MLSHSSILQVLNVAGRTALLLAANMSFSAFSESAPVEFEAESLDLGSLYRGQPSPGAFLFTNKSDVPVSLRSLHSSCGCLNVRMQPNQAVGPGETGRLEFEFDSRHFVGNISRQIIADFNQSTNASVANSAVNLQVTANIKEEISVKPAMIILGTLDRNIEKEVTVSISTFARASENPNKSIETQIVPDQLKTLSSKILANIGPIKPLIVTSSSPLITGEISPDLASIIVKIRGPLPTGNFRESLTLWNNSTYLKELYIPVIGEVIGGVTSQKYIEFGAITLKSPSSRTLTLRNARPEFKIENIVFDLRPTQVSEELRSGGLLTATVQRIENGLAVVVMLRVPPKFAFPNKLVNVSGAVVVKTNDPDYNEIRVPFFGVLKNEVK